METKKLKITPPEGYEIDKENSTFECIKFKPIKKLTYNDICNKLEKKFHKDKSLSKISHAVFYDEDTPYPIYDSCTSQKQVQKLLAINKLMNVAKYLNGDWKPFNSNIITWYIEIDNQTNKIEYNWTIIYVSHIAYFKTRELAKQAIEILGEDTIRLALSTDW